MPRGAFRINISINRSHRQNREASKTNRHSLLKVALAFAIPLLIVASAWGSGLVRFPALENATGFTPLFARSQDPNLALTVDAPQNGSIITSPTTFTGHTKPGASVIFWNAGVNVPTQAQADATGVWRYEFNPATLSNGAASLVFSANDGTSWSPKATRVVQIVLPSAPSAPPWVHGIADPLPSVVSVPLLTIAGAGASVLHTIDIQLTQTTGLNLQNDLNQNGVPDWLESTPIQPTDVPPNAVIQAPRYVNVLLLAAVILVPGTIVFLRNPAWLGPLLNRIVAFREKRKAAARRADMARQAGDRRERMARQAGVLRERLAREERSFRERTERFALAEKLREVMAKRDVSLARASAASSTATQRALAKREARRADVQVKALDARMRLADERIERIRLEEARVKRDGSPSTVINVRAPHKATRRRGSVMFD